MMDIEAVRLSEWLRWLRGTECIGIGSHRGSNEELNWLGRNAMEEYFLSQAL
jgi:hypothetical protein